MRGSVERRQSASRLPPSTERPTATRSMTTAQATRVADVSGTRRRPIATDRSRTPHAARATNTEALSKQTMPTSVITVRQARFELRG